MAGVAAQDQAEQLQEQERQPQQKGPNGNIAVILIAANGCLDVSSASAELLHGYYLAPPRDGQGNDCYFVPVFTLSPSLTLYGQAGALIRSLRYNRLATLLAGGPRAGALCCGTMMILRDGGTVSVTDDDVATVVAQITNAGAGDAIVRGGVQYDGTALSDALEEQCVTWSMC